MPNGSDLLSAVRTTLGSILFDIEPAQAIYDVAVRPEPEGATITFATTRPCFATVELFRMVTGKVDLDMEKESRERVELELFGSARLAHRVRFFDLPQERRFWYRISVPGEGPGTALGQKKVRHRGWFSTFRRTATCRIGWIHVLSDSDDQSAGDLVFELAAYDAARAPALLEQADGFLLACRGPGGRLLVRRLDREAYPTTDPLVLTENVRDDIVLGGSGAGRRGLAGELETQDRADGRAAGDLDEPGVEERSKQATEPARAGARRRVGGVGLDQHAEGALATVATGRVPTAPGQPEPQTPAAGHATPRGTEQPLEVRPAIRRERMADERHQFIRSSAPRMRSSAISSRSGWIAKQSRMWLSLPSPKV